MAKQARISFSLTDFGNNILTRDFLQDLWDDLPLDAVVVHMEFNPSSLRYSFVVESHNFIDTAPTVPLPEITYTIVSGSVTNSCGGEVVLDLSKAMAPKVSIPPPTAVCTCGTCNSCIINSMHNRTLGTAPYIPSAGGIYNYQISPGSIYASPSIPKRTGYTVGIDKAACTHDPKIYDSGWNVYSYCSKCNVKLDV